MKTNDKTFEILKTVTKGGKISPRETKKENLKI